MVIALTNAGRESVDGSLNLGDHLPLNDGGRFSRNAFIPSF